MQTWITIWMILYLTKWYTHILLCGSFHLKVATAASVWSLYEVWVYKYPHLASCQWGVLACHPIHIHGTNISSKHCNYSFVGERLTHPGFKSKLLPSWQCICLLYPGDWDIIITRTSHGICSLFMFKVKLTNIELNVLCHTLVWPAHTRFAPHLPLIISSQHHYYITYTSPTHHLVLNYMTILPHQHLIQLLFL